MTTPPLQPGPEELRSLRAVLSGLRAIAEGRLAGLAIAPAEYLADIYCIQRVASLLAMELSALGRSLRRPETQQAADEVHRIEEVLVQAFAAAGLRLEDCYLDLTQAAVRPVLPRRKEQA